MRKLVLFLIACLATSGAAAQSPAVGPPEPAANLSYCTPTKSNAPCKSDFALSIVTSMIRTMTQKVLDGANEELKKRGHSSRVSIETLRVNLPRRMQTQHLNQPNEWFIHAPYSLTVKVAIPVVADRRIHLPIDINVTCNNWHTDNGQVVVRSVTGPASFEGGSIIEDIFNIGNYIDSQVRKAFVAPPPVTQQLPNAKCVTIGVSNRGTAQPEDDILIWTVPGSGPKVPLQDVVAKPSSLEVTFNRLKRLNARSLGGAVLYKDVEDIFLNLSANTSRQQKALKMREGDDLALSLPVIRLDPAKSDTLVLVANVEQPPNNPKDSASVTATKAQNYRAGTHVVRIPKWYSLPPSKGNPKPTLLSLPAYELSYTVRYVPGGMAGVLDTGKGGAGAAGTGAATGGGAAKQLLRKEPAAILQRK